MPWLPLGRVGGNCAKNDTTVVCSLRRPIDDGAARAARIDPSPPSNAARPPNGVHCVDRMWWIRMRPKSNACDERPTAPQQGARGTHDAAEEPERRAFARATVVAETSERLSEGEGGSER